MGRIPYRTMPLSQALIVASLLCASMAAYAGIAKAAEIIPSVGLTRSVDSDEVKSLVGLGLRGTIIPGVSVLKGEIGAQYRQEKLYDGDLTLRQFPVTASLWVSPIPSLYVGGGAGWYHTAFEYADATGLDDRTEQAFGVHVGGGLQVPIIPSAALDLNGRYVFLEDQESHLIPETFDPDFWSLSLGLAIGH